MFGIRDFFAEESGAVTVDWVVLTAAILGLSLAVTLIVGTGAHDHGERIGDTMAAQGIRSAY